MTRGEFVVTVAASPEDVWPWVADLGKHAEWSTKAYRVEWISGEPNQVGSRYRSVGWVPMDKDHVNEGEIVEVRAPTRFALRAEDREGTFNNVYDLRPVDGGTEVTFTLEFPQMKGLNAAMVPILFAVSGKPDIRKRMQLLKAKVEGTG